MTATWIGLLLVGMGCYVELGLVNPPGKLFNRIFGDIIAPIIYFAAGISLFAVGIGRMIGAHWF